MARMHSGARGKSGSKKPIKRIPSWAPYKEKEVEKLVVKYAKSGKNQSEIGMILRDSYGIHSVKALSGKSVSAIQKENNITPKLPDDIIALIKRLISIHRHLETNRHDQTARRGLILTNSKIHRLVIYYKKSKTLPKNWELDQTKLKMYVE